MAQSYKAADVAADMAEFLRLADDLDMPEAEQRGILGLSPEAFAAWHGGTVADQQPVAAALPRRLAYSLPLVRRLTGRSPALSFRPTPLLATHHHA